jgi:hypothetical protein
MAGVLRVVGGLAGVVGLLLLWAAAWLAVTWLIGLILRYAIFVGRRHRRGPREGRQPIETESSKLGPRRSD